MSYMKEGERNMPQTAAHLTDKKKKNNRGDRRWRQAGKERISVKITEKKLAYSKYFISTKLTRD
ncbi:hypothetical protein LINGRAHAP2_LOCUS24415 [Linum grandiflorum]